VWRHRLTAAFQKNPKGYLYRAAVNLSVDVVRARKPLTLLTELEHVIAAEVTPYSEVCGISRKQLSEALSSFFCARAMSFFDSISRNKQGSNQHL
jgi:hypothetical protein